MSLYSPNDAYLEWIPLMLGHMDLDTCMVYLFLPSDLHTIKVLSNKICLACIRRLEPKINVFCYGCKSPTSPDHAQVFGFIHYGVV